MVTCFLFLLVNAITIVFNQRQRITVKSVGAIQFFYKKLLDKKLLLSFLPNYNRNTAGYCFHNSRKQKKIKKLSVLRFDPSFL